MTNIHSPYHNRNNIKEYYHQVHSQPATLLIAVVLVPSHQAVLLQVVLNLQLLLPVYPHHPLRTQSRHRQSISLSFPALRTVRVHDCCHWLLPARYYSIRSATPAASVSRVLPSSSATP